MWRALRLLRDADDYHFDQFAVERLMQFLTALNQDVEIMIRPRAKKGGAGHISVLALP